MLLKKGVANAVKKKNNNNNKDFKKCSEYMAIYSVKATKKKRPVWW